MANSEETPEIIILDDNQTTTTKKNDVRKDIRRTYTFAEKNEVLKMLDKEPFEVVAAKIDVHPATLKSWIKNSEKIRKMLKESAVSKNKKKSQKSKFAIIGEKLYVWYLRAKKKKLLITGPILQKESLRISRELGINDFAGNMSWIDTWKQAKGIKISLYKNFKKPATPSNKKSKGKNAEQAVEPKKSRNYYTFDVKLNALKLLRTSTFYEASKELNIDQKVLRDWTKQTKEIEAMCQDTATMTRKKYYRVNKPVIEEKLYEWYLKVVQEKVMVLSDEILREQALRIAEEINDTEFIAPIAWLRKWIQDKNIKISEYNESLGTLPFHQVNVSGKLGTTETSRVKTKNKNTENLLEQENTRPEKNFGTVDDSNNYHSSNGFNSNKENTTMATTNLQNVGNSMSKLNTKDSVDPKFHKSNESLHIKHEVITEEENNCNSNNIHDNLSDTRSSGGDSADTVQALDQIDNDMLDLMKSEQKTYSCKGKLAILKWFEKTPIVDLANELGVPRSILSKWARRAKQIEEMEQRQSRGTVNTNRRSLRKFQR